MGSYFDPKLKVEGIKLNISNWRRPAPNTIPWDTKASGLYMICTLSKHEAEKEGYTDSLMLDHDGNVAEATGAIFFSKIKWRNSHTYSRFFFRRITRRTVIEIAKSKGIKVHERKINPSELQVLLDAF
jgi:branched-chain amino acid aminotransferase